MWNSCFNTRNDILVATYADDTAIMAQSKTPEAAAAAVQHHLLALESWLRKWRIKINRKIRSSNIYTPPPSHTSNSHER